MLKQNRPNPQDPVDTRRHGARRRSRGSVIIIVVVSIVLLTVIGAVYLQVAQVQRAVAAEPIDNIDTILASIVQEMLIQSGEDVFSATDDRQFGAGVEPYDAPTVNTSATRSITDPLDASVTGNAVGGQYDDVWLASTAVSFPGGQPRWAKITDLSGMYFMTNANATMADRWPMPSLQRITDNSSAFHRSTTLNPGLLHLYDADGDGLADSRYERAPIPLMTGVDYYMAVRIIDASALLNLAAATSMTSNGGDGTNNYVTGYFPTSLDMSRLINKRTGSGNASANLATFFAGLRGGHALADPAASVPTGHTAFPSSYPTPFALYDVNYNGFPAANTYGGGQVAAWRDEVSQPGNLAPYASAQLALAYRGSAYEPSNPTPYETQLGTALARTDGDATAVASYWAPDATDAPPWTSIRHMVSTVTGKAAFSPHYDQTTAANTVRHMFDLQYDGDTNNNGTVTTQERASEIRDRLASIFAIGATGIGIDTTNRGAATTAGRSSAAATPFAAMIAEYIDENNAVDAELTDAQGVKWYGLEPLPFLRETYIQIGYADSGADADTSGFNEWDPMAATQAVAVELGNPFDRPIDVSNAPVHTDKAQVRVRITQGGTQVGTAVELNNADDLATRIAAPATHAEYVREQRILYSIASSQFNEDGAAGTGANLFVSIGNSAWVSAYRSAGIDTLSFNADGTQIVVELQVEVPSNSGNWVTYDRLTHSDFAMPAQIEPTGNTSAKTQGHYQRSIKREGRGIGYISNEGVAVVSRDIASQATWPADGYAKTGNSPVDSLDAADDNKGVTGSASLVSSPYGLQLPVANRAIFSVAELGWIPMFGFNDTSNGDFPTLFSGTDGTGTPASGAIPINERFLFAAGGPAVTDAINADGVGGNDVSYAEAVMAEFTTLSPVNDGVDNDGDGSIDEADEQFIFGTMNINTAPEHIAALAASSPGTITQNRDLVRALQTSGPMKSVGQMVAAANGASGQPALGAVHELYPLFEATLSGPHPTHPTPAPADYGGQNAVAYETTGAEETTQRAQFLLQNFTVRSDIFIAHIYAAGFVDTDSNLGNGYEELIESGRMIVVFSRANMTSGDDTPEVLATYRY